MTGNKMLILSSSEKVFKSLYEHINAATICILKYLPQK